MKPATNTVTDLFEVAVRYVVPLYQRAYVWNEDDQWEPLWEDIEMLLEHQLEEPGSSTPPSHFLGAIVLEQETQSPGKIPVYTVIDGQQRLTTLQLLLAAAAREAQAHGVEDEAALLGQLVRNNPLKAKGDEVFKVWPTNRNRTAFTACVSDGGPDGGHEDDPDNLIDEAFDYFRRRVREWVSQEATVEERFRLLRVTLSDLLKMVSITLEPGDNAQVIFETLNARGTPLLALDLVKNAVFHDAVTQGLDADTLYHQHWQPELDSDYWQKERRQGRLKRAAGELFLMHWLAMHLDDPIRVSELFKVFRERILSKQPSPEDLITKLCADAKVMRGFDDFPPDTVEGRFFRRLEALDTSTVYALVLFLSTKPDVTRESRRECLRMLESWLVRRALMAATTRDYNKFFPVLIKKIQESSEPAEVVLRKQLESESSPTRRWPKDADLITHLTTKPLYGWVKQSRVVMVLHALEEDLRRESPGTEAIGLPSKLSIEHLMPQKWQASWPLPKHLPEESAALERERRIHLIGNCTLVTPPLNAGLSNGPWPAKAKALKSQSLLLLNARLVDEYPDVFTEADIDQRSRVLAERICKVWPGPASGS